MRLRCADGIVRQFSVCVPGPGLWAHCLQEAHCNNCQEKFGVHDTSILKPLFLRHICGETEKRRCQKPEDHNFTFDEETPMQNGVFMVLSCENCGLIAEGLLPYRMVPAKKKTREAPPSWP